MGALRVCQRSTFECVVCVCGCRVLSPRPGCSRRASSATPSRTQTPPPLALPVTSSMLPRSLSATPCQLSSALWRSSTQWWGRHMQQGTSGRMQGCAAPWAQLLSFSQFVNLPIDILIRLCAALCSCCSVRQLNCHHCGLHAVRPRFCRSTTTSQSFICICSKRCLPMAAGDKKKTQMKCVTLQHEVCVTTPARTRVHLH